MSKDVWAPLAVILVGIPIMVVWIIHERRWWKRMREDMARSKADHERIGKILDEIEADERERRLHRGLPE